MEILSNVLWRNLHIRLCSNLRRHARQRKGLWLSGALVLDIRRMGLPPYSSLLRPSMVSQALNQSAAIALSDPGQIRVCILVALSIYLLAGRFIFQKRHQLRAFNVPVEDLPFTSYDPSTIKVTKEFASLPSTITDASSPYLPPPPSTTKDNKAGGRFSDMSSMSYSVNVSSRPALPHKLSSSGVRRNRAAMEANRAAYNYTKIASLFFVSLLVTWVPSSINRVYSLIRPDSVNVEYAYAAGIVLSLMGFWNSVIYIATSHHACKELFSGTFQKGSCVSQPHDRRGSLAMRSRGRASWGDSVEGLAGERNSV